MGDSDPLMEFITVTEAEPALAQLFLEKCNWDLQEAIQQFLEDPMRYVVDDGPSAQPASDDTVRAPIEPRRMRLQDDFFQEDMPMPRRQEVKRPRVVFEHMADLRSEALARVQALAKGGRRGDAAKPRGGKVDQLAELFRPPYEIMQQGTFEAVQKVAERRESWMLVTIHNDTEFDCQKLNRDVWKDAEIQKIIKNNFVFWQVRHDSPEGTEYMQIYTVAHLPHIAVIDPRTGELLWMREEFLDAKSMAAELRAFLRTNSFDGDVDIDLTKHSYDEKPIEIVEGFAPPTRQSSSSMNGHDAPPVIKQMSEEEMLEAAIKASLEDSQPQHHDDDAQPRVIKGDDDDDDDGDVDDDDTGIQIVADDDDARNRKRKVQSDPGFSSSAPPLKKTKIEETSSNVDDSMTFKTSYPAPLAEDPSRGPKDCTIQLRLPNGTTMTKQFYSTDLVGSVVFVIQTEAGIQKEVQLKTMFPKKTFTEEELQNETLAAAKLTPRAVLIVEVDG